MFKLYTLGLLVVSGQLCGMQADVKTKVELEELKRRSDESTQRFYDQVRAMKAEQGEKFDPNIAVRSSAAEENSRNLSSEELKRRSDESTQAFLDAVRAMKAEKGEYFGPNGESAPPAAHMGQSQGAEAHGQADAKSDAAGRAAEGDKPTLSEKQQQFIENLQKQFHASKLKKELWDNIVKNLQREGNNNFSADDLEDGFELFAEAFEELASESSRQATLDIQTELNRCRGSYVGGFCYSFYKPSWRMNIESYHRKKYVSVASLKSISDLARAKGAKMPEACAVLNALEKELAQANLRNFHRFCMEAEDLHRTATTKFARAIIKNRNRVMVGFVAIAAIACVIYKKTRSEY